ncbi:MAG TPA: hypothetical protein VNW95_00085 [Mucilaginibacter sp.]|jgi:hypothetical protein|nr:hypothetical protein [Mucilaginibacter sp.]
MAQKLNELITSESESAFQFLSEQAQVRLDQADANRFVRICTPDKVIPFIVTTDGGVIADITANNPKTIVENLKSIIPAAVLRGGAGFIEVFHGNKLLVLRHVESSVFEKKWLADDIASALQFEFDVYYPGYRIRSR